MALSARTQALRTGSARGLTRPAGLPTVPRIHTTKSSRHSADLVARAGRVTKITGEQLEVEIQDRDRPLIVDFFATWCGPCLLLAQELEKVAEQLGDQVKILKIDVDENPTLSSQLRIEGLPTLVFIPKDPAKPALRTEGLMPAAQIVDILGDMSK